LCVGHRYRRPVAVLGRSWLDCGGVLTGVQEKIISFWSPFSGCCSDGFAIQP
jgi:hypothetical protein